MGSALPAVPCRCPPTCLVTFCDEHPMLVLVPLYYVSGGKGLNPGPPGQGACWLLSRVALPKGQDLGFPQG